MKLVCSLLLLVTFQAASSQTQAIHIIPQPVEIQSLGWIIFPP